MKYYSKKQWTHKLTVMVLLAMALGGTAVQAMPSGGDIRSGQGSISQDGKNMTVLQNSDRMAIDWTKFDIAKDETVRYTQPDRNAISLNRVTGGQQSVIAGNLNANGNVVLVNPNGVVFTKNSSVDVGGLVASTARLNDEAMKNFGNGKDSLDLSLDKDSTASVINEGQIKAQGGLVALHAANVENKGTITNEGGTLAMAAAKNLTLSAADDDKLNFTVDGDLAKAQALNSGSLKADGGYVVMTAKSAGDVLSTVVNNSGTIEAKTLRKNEKGQILLDGGDNGQVEVSGTLDASGTEAGQDAGNIKVIGQKTVVHDNTNLLAKGDNNGGKIETSGDVLNLGDNLNIDAKGVNGKAGEWLLDPLEILIQDDRPTLGTADQTIGAVNEGSETQITYNDPPSATQNADATYSSTSWIKTSLITDILNKGTDVTIQAASTSQAASITVNSAITPTVGGDGDATLTLEAQRNITINKEIKADASGGKLNVKLNSDTDGDGVGAVIINADISTNGGSFTSGSGGNVKFTAPQGTADGAYATTGIDKDTKSNIEGNTVGTYFGYATPTGSTVIGTKENRNVSTNGGAINLYGEVAIGLNGGTLTLDTSKSDGTTGGNLNITGIINSGNSYDDYIYGTAAWDNLVSSLVQEYLDHNSVPSYRFVGINYKKNTDGTYTYTTEAKHFDQGESHYAFHELQSGDVNGTNWTYTNSEPTLDTQHTRWYATTTAGDGYNSFIMEGTTPETSQMSIDEWLIYYRRTEPDNYAKKYANGNTNTKTNLVTYDTIKNDATKLETLKSDISALIAHNWFASKSLANPGDKSGANPGDSYLATITTALENSLSTPNSQKTLWVGGRGSGVRNKTNDKTTNPYSQYPADPTHQDGFYWVTGPEGLVTNEDGTTGTKFWDTSKSYWNKALSKSNYGEQVYGYTKWSSWSGGGQPDNSAPFLTVGYGNNNAWDDAAIDGGTTVGFVQETNLYNSSLNVKTAGGKVTLQGDIGKSVGLDTVKIDAGSGSVTTGNTNNKATKYNNGTIYADHGVYINGGEVTVGGEIHSGGADVETTRNTDASFKDYLDNVTIQSSGNLTVHGIEVSASTDPSGNTTSRTDGEGGKIKLTSTGTDGVITLGDGVDYNGKNTNGGVLKAASTAQGAVVIDAQGSNGGFVNKTSAEKAIDTSGTWQIYSASPDKDTFGTNLNSGTDAQWTSKSASNTIATKNQYGKNPNSYSDIGSNKFIFQSTPVITLYSEDYLKTYGDEVSADTLNKLLKGKEVFTGLDGKTHNVTDYSSAFQEKDYTEYISGEDAVTITSDGAASTATRTGGKYEATEKSGADGKNAVYDLTVNLNDAKALDGYAIDTENGKLEIKKRTASITGKGTQTYGDTDGIIKNWTDTQTNIAKGSTVTYDTSVKSGSAYTDNQKDRNTADYGTYENSVSFDNLKITDAKGNEVSIADNYDLTTTGTITVGKAKLIVNTDGKTTTYGTVDESYTSKLDDSTKALNGDDADKLISDLGLTYKTDAYQDTDGDGKYDRTNHVKYTSDDQYDSYMLDVANTNTLKNYDVTVNDSTVILERAKATVDTDKVTTNYGKVDTSYTSHFNTAVNGDNGENLLKQLDLSYSTDAYKDADHTNNVKDGGYDLKVQAKGSLTYNDYDVTVNDSNVTLNKVNLTVNPEDIHRIYGQAKEVQEDAKTAYNLSGFVNGDTKDTVDATNKDGKTIDQLVKVTNDVSKALKDDGTHTQNASAAGYDMETDASGDLTNYNVVVGDSKKVYLDKAALVVDTTGNTRTYGDVSNVASDVANAASFHLFGSKDKTVNGDTEADILKELGLSTSSDAQVKDDAGKVIKTGNANTDPGYDIKAAFNKDLTNYTVSEGTVGKEKIEKAALVVDTTGNTRTYGDVSNVSSDVANAASFHVKNSRDVTLNGDSYDDILNSLNIATDSQAQVKDGNGNVIKTGDANTDPGYDITATFNTDLTNYTVEKGTVGQEKIEKAALVVDTKGNTRTYGDASGVANDVANAASFHLSGSTDATANGDSYDDILKEMNLTTDSKAQIKDENGTVVKTGNANTNPGYDIKAAFDTELKNYTVSEGDVGKEKIEKATLVVDTKGNTRTYGDVNGVSSDVANAASFHIKGSEATTVNGDTYADILKEMNLSTDSAAQIKDASGNVIETGNANTNPGYDIKASFDTDLTNYAVEEGTVGKEKIEKATLHLSTGDYKEAYGDAGAVQKDLNSATTVKGEKNGDSLAELMEKIGITNTTDALLSADRTNDVKYKTDGSLDSYGITTNFNKSLDNYEVVLDKAGTVTLTPKEITIKNTMTQQYGSSDRTYKEATVPEGQLVNGDSISTKDLKFDIKSDGEYAKSLAANGSDAVTADAGTYTGELIHTGGGITHADGSDAYKNYKVTVEGDIVVTPAPLTITTKDVTTEYGTVKNTTSTATGLVNGDQNYASDISYDYGDYGHGYLDNNTRTNNVGSYGITTKAANTTSDFLNNYTISYGDAKLTITPKDVYFHVDGKGSTFDDIIYTVTDPNHPGSSDVINSQLPYGETVTGGYGLGRALPDTPGSKDHYYTVDSTINGTPVYDNNGQGTQVGNYIYHPTGQAVIHFDQPQKPDQTTHYVEGARRPQDKIESALPVFRVDAEGTVKQYGTYGIENKTQTVVLSPTGMRMPEPNQTSTQDRKYMTSLKTPDGQGTFRLEYNGVVLRVIPVDPAAEQIVEAGDKLKNVALSEQALHVAYTQMGLDLVNLKGVYIYMAPMSV